MPKLKPSHIFHIGDIVRYRKGNTALLKIESVYDYGGKVGRQFTGLHICGDIHSAYESDCTRATALDHARWADYKGDRIRITANWASGHKDMPFDQSSER